MPKRERRLALFLHRTKRAHPVGPTHAYFDFLNRPSCSYGGTSSVLSRDNPSLTRPNCRLFSTSRGSSILSFLTKSSRHSTLAREERRYAPMHLTGTQRPTHPLPTRHQQQFAQQVLTQFQDSPDAWTRVPDIMERCTFPQTKVCRI